MVSFASGWYSAIMTTTATRVWTAMSFSPLQRDDELILMLDSE